MLLIPGPVDVPDIVRDASAYVVNHRSGEFREIVSGCRNILSSLSDATESIITTGSGTTAVESMVYSFNKPGDDVLCFSFGEFGNRLGDSIKTRGCNLTLVKKDTNSTVKSGEISELVSRNKKISSVYFVHNETGNGTELKNLRELASEAKSLGLSVYVDSVSGFGATELKVNDWSIDAVATCSQKGIASTPGLGIVMLGDEAVKKLTHRDFCPSYLDLSVSLKFFQKNETPYTPSTGSFRSLYFALRILEKEGMERRVKRHKTLSDITRKAIERLDANIYGIPQNYSNSVIAFKPVMGVSNFVSKLAEEGIEVSRGMSEYRDSMVRVGILGVVDNVKIARFINASNKISGSSETVDPEKLPEETRFDQRWTEI